MAAVFACLVAAQAGALVQPGERWHRGLPRGPVPGDEVLVRNGAVIGDIYLHTDNIFDPEQPGEDKLLHRLANGLHVTTRPQVIEQRLLFREGDRYDPRLLKETARHLRSLDFLYDAWVEPIRYRNNRVDVLVRTRDVWTLGMGAGFERSGGENTLQLQIQESNVLGTGRFLDLKLTDDPDRSSSRFRYVDTALLGSRAELRLWYAHNSDGHRRIVDISRPFYSLDTRWGGGAKLISDEREEKIYRQGEVIQSFQHETTRGEIQAGISKGFRNGRARRWLVGYTYERDRFWERPDSSVPGGEAPGPLPAEPLPGPRSRLPDKSGGDDAGAAVPGDRRLSYFWFGVEEVEDGFIEARNMDQLRRTEDFNLGLHYHARLGWSSPTWGGDQSQAIFSADVGRGFALKPGQILLLSGHTSGRWGGSGHEDVSVGGEARYFWRNFGRHRLHATVQADAAWNLDPENQLLLGGESGLRGYPRRFQDGDRRFLFSLEQRFYTDRELFRLVNVGAAVFFDAGRAWWSTGPEAGRDQGLLMDVGLGLRLSTSRSARGQMVHLDVAFPLNGDTDEVQWLVTSKKSF